MTRGRSFAELRAMGAELREMAARGLAMAEELDARLAAAGWPTSQADAEIITFPAASIDVKADIATHPASAIVIDLAARRTAGVR